MAHSEKVYQISGLDCASCALNLEEKLKKCKDIESVNVDYLASKLYVITSLTKEEIEDEMNKIEEGITLSSFVDKEKKHDEYQKLIFKIGRILISLLAAFLALFLFPVEEFGIWPYLALTIFAWIISGYDLIYHAIKGIVTREDIFSESLLMSIASLGAFLLPIFNQNFDSCFDAVLVVVFYQVGEIFTDFATRKSHQAILDTLSMKKEIAHKKAGNEILDVPASSIKKGDILLIKLGESISSDGKIIEGEGEIDCSSLTGEFAPRYAKVGDEVFSSNVLKSGNLVVEATKDYQDSTASQLLSLVEGATKEKGRTEKMISRFARWYTPLVMGLAIVFAILPPLITGYQDQEVWTKWISVALSMLVISCPCAIVLSIPLCYFSGIGAMGRHGLLLKGTEYVDVLSSVESLLTDKTGTLTEGKFSIADVFSIYFTPNEFLSLIALGESRSNHPIAYPFKPYYMSEEEEYLSSYEEIPGKGIKAIYRNESLLIGTKSFLESEGIRQIHEVKGTVIHVAYQKKYYGFVLLTDSYKKGSKELFAYLKREHISTCLLTGDNEVSAKKAQQELGIDRIYYSLLPEEKTEKIREEKGLIRKGKSIVYVGDGINDAASLALADCGIAMGALGSGLAMNSADVLLMNDDPSYIVDAIKIAKKTKALAYFILAFALLLKIVILISSLIIGPSFPLWAAVFGDTGLTIITILFSLIPLTFGKKVYKN